MTNIAEKPVAYTQKVLRKLPSPEKIDHPLLNTTLQVTEFNFSSSGNEDDNNSLKTDNLESGSPKESKMLYPSLEDMKVDQMTKVR